MKSNYIKHILLILIFSLVFNSDKKQQNFIENPWLWASSKKVGATNVSTKVTTDNGVITEIVSKKDEETIVIETYETYPHASYVTILTINKNGGYSIACGSL